MAEIPVLTHMNQMANRNALCALLAIPATTGVCGLFPGRTGSDESFAHARHATMLVDEARQLPRIPWQNSGDQTLSGIRPVHQE